MPKKISNAAKHRKNRAPFGSQREEAAAAETDSSKTGASHPSSGNRVYLIVLFLAIALGGTYVMNVLKNLPVDVPRFTYKLIETYPHDPSAFTQGLVLENGMVYESTGKYGKSTIRRYPLGSEANEKLQTLPSDQFGEGLAMVNDKLYQITWKEEVCHVYDKDLNKVKQFQYNGHGWGLAFNGKHLIMSDGTSRLHFIDPETFEDRDVVTVRNGRLPINELNELEFSGGKIYANRLGFDKIYEIDPRTGQIEAIIDLAGLWEDRPREGVLNGIAVDAKTGKLIVTGKYCPNIFEIELIPQPSK